MFNTEGYELSADWKLEGQIIRQGEMVKAPR